MADEDRVVRNLVLSVCDFKLRAADTSSEPSSYPLSAHPPTTSPSSSLCITPRVGSRMAVIRGRHLLLHGGADEKQCYADLQLIEIEKAQWHSLKVGGFQRPTGRYGHSFSFYDDDVFLFGGLAADPTSSINVLVCPPPMMDQSSPKWQHQPKPSDDFFVFKTDTMIWKQPETTGDAPGPRAFHAAAVCCDCLFIFGGCLDDNFRQATDELFILDLQTKEWLPPAIAASQEDPRDLPLSSSSSSSSAVPNGETKLSQTSEADTTGATTEAATTTTETAAVSSQAEGSVSQNSKTTPAETTSSSSSSSSSSSLEDAEEKAQKSESSSAVKGRQDSPSSLSAPSPPPSPLSSSSSIRICISGVSPSPRYGHDMASIQNNNVILLIGGSVYDTQLYCLDVHLNRGDDSSSYSILNMQLTWTVVQTTQNGPSSRCFLTVAMLGADRFVVFGGRNNSCDDVGGTMYAMSWNTKSWSKPLYEGDLSVCGAAAAVLHDKLITFGGSELTQPAKATGNIMSWTSNRVLFLSVLEVRKGRRENMLRFKLVAVGDSGVGKSCLLVRFIRDSYMDLHVCTIGVDFLSLVTLVRGRMCTLQLWDTAGQERYSGITSNYYRGADGFVLVYDSTDKNSFINLRKWIKQIKEHHECGKDTLFLLLGNKADLRDEKVVTDEEAQKFAKEIGAVYAPTSAKTAVNVDTAFLAAAAQLVQRRIKPPTETLTTTEGTSTGQSDADVNNSVESRGITLTSLAPAVRRVCGGCSSVQIFNRNNE